MPPAINADALALQTFGDAELAAEILAMFKEHAASLIPALGAASGPARGEVAHRLKGSALAIGAGALAAAAAEVEADPSRADLVQRVEEHCAAVLAEIVAYSATGRGGAPH